MQFGVVVLVRVVVVLLPNVVVAIVTVVTTSLRNADKLVKNYIKISDTMY